MVQPAALGEVDAGQPLVPFVRATDHGARAFQFLQDPRHPGSGEVEHLSQVSLAHPVAIPEEPEAHGGSGVSILFGQGLLQQAVVQLERRLERPEDAERERVHPVGDPGRKDVPGYHADFFCMVCCAVCLMVLREIISD
jgi:hypothetical protein